MINKSFLMMPKSGLACFNLPWTAGWPAKQHPCYDAALRQYYGNPAA
jgi:hypothetical protein